MAGELVPFIDDMARRYAEADLVICRAGAVTVAELSAGGLASVLVVPFNVRGQTRGVMLVASNARTYEPEDLQFAELYAQAREKVD